MASGTSNGTKSDSSTLSIGPQGLSVPLISLRDDFWLLLEWIVILAVVFLLLHHIWLADRTRYSRFLLLSHLPWSGGLPYCSRELERPCWDDYDRVQRAITSLFTPSAIIPTWLLGISGEVEKIIYQTFIQFLTTMHFSGRYI
jgi:hypothetical protein